MFETTCAQPWWSLWLVESIYAYIIILQPASSYGKQILHDKHNYSPTYPPVPMVNLNQFMIRRGPCCEVVSMARAELKGTLVPTLQWDLPGANPAAEKGCHEFKWRHALQLNVEASYACLHSFQTIADTTSAAVKTVLGYEPI